MERSEELYRHLTDLYRRAEQRNAPVFSTFLSPAEQEDFRRDPPKGGIRFSFEGGFPDAERRILVCGSEEDLGFRPEPPLRFLRFSPVSDKYSEELTHRDYLGAILSLGIERNLVGDLLIRENRAAVVCLEQAVPLLLSLKEVRRTRVTGEECGPDLPEFTPVFREISVNIASERLDILVAAFCGLSRNHAAPLFPAGRVLINGRPETGPGKKIREGSVISVRGFGKFIYDGVSGESKKGRLFAVIRKYV